MRMFSTSADESQEQTRDTTKAETSTGFKAVRYFNIYYTFLAYIPTYINVMDMYMSMATYYTYPLVIDISLS